MNKQSHIILGLVICSLVLAGCKQQAIDKILPTAEPVNETGVFNTIKEAVSKQMAIECEYTDPEDGIKQKVFFKGQVIAIRAGENNMNQKDVAGLIKDNKVYFWSLKPENKDGMWIDLTKVTDKNNVSIADKSIRSNEDAVEAMEPYRQNCKPTTDTKVFELPSDKNFTNNWTN